MAQFGIDRKDAPDSVKMSELRALKTVLSELNTNILLNPDLAEAFQNRPSLLLSQVGLCGSKSWGCRHPSRAEPYLF